MSKPKNKLLGVDISDDVAPLEGEKKTAYKFIGDEDIIDFLCTDMQISTFKKTLTKYPDSNIAKMVSDENIKSLKVSDGNRYLIERDPWCFQQIINFLRTDHIFLQKDDKMDLLKAELEYFGLSPYISFKETKEFKGYVGSAVETEEKKE